MKTDIEPSQVRLPTQRRHLFSCGPRLAQPVRLSVRRIRTPRHILSRVSLQRKVIGHPKSNKRRNRRRSIRTFAIPLQSTRWNIFLETRDHCRGSCFPKSWSPAFLVSVDEQIRPDNHSNLPATYSDFSFRVWRCSPCLRRQVCGGHHGPVDTRHIGVRKANVGFDVRCSSATACFPNRCTGCGKGASCTRSWSVVLVSGPAT